MPHSVATPTECLTVTMFVSAALNSSSSKLGGVNDGAVLCGGFTFISQMLWSVGGRIVSVDCVIISLVNTPLNFVNPPTRTCRQCMAVRPEATVHINTLCLSLVIISLHFIANRAEFSDLQKWQDCIGSAFRFFSNLSALALR